MDESFVSIDYSTSDVVLNASDLVVGEQWAETNVAGYNADSVARLARTDIYITTE